MVLPIVAYGSSILRKRCVDIDKDYPGLQELIADMWETMYESSGVGLAALAESKNEEGLAANQSWRGQGGDNRLIHSEWLQ